MIDGVGAVDCSPCNFLYASVFPTLLKIHCEIDASGFCAPVEADLFFSTLCFRERNCLLKEAEVLHKARFNHIIQILGICNEPEFFCIVTEYMSNGSLDLLLHQVATWENSLLFIYIHPDVGILTLQIPDRRDSDM